ncbi:unnamed protein product [Symbiodinium sp. KB8]|nr:unnamed protein product [Symbiodinium sp. KB8]
MDVCNLAPARESNVPKGGSIRFGRAAFHQHWCRSDANVEAGGVDGLLTGGKLIVCRCSLARFDSATRQDIKKPYICGYMVFLQAEFEEQNHSGHLVFMLAVNLAGGIHLLYWGMWSYWRADLRLALDMKAVYTTRVRSDANVEARSFKGAKLPNLVYPGEDWPLKDSMKQARSKIASLFAAALLKAASAATTVLAEVLVFSQLSPWYLTGVVFTVLAEAARIPEGGVLGFCLSLGFDASVAAFRPCEEQDRRTCLAFRGD